jgi:hypothetical protein
MKWSVFFVISVELNQQILAQIFTSCFAPLCWFGAILTVITVTTVI